jgi:hypothetical protein
VTWTRHLAGSVDAASVVVFRVGFGLLMLIEVARFFIHGWIDDLYRAPTVHFKYLGVDWVTAWPGSGLDWHFAATGLFAALVCFGFLYRFAILGLLVCFAYIFLLDQAAYLNQYYLVLTFAALLCVIPAASPTVPRWSVWALRLQTEIFLVYAGLVKLNGDWLAGQPLELWLDSPTLALPASYGVVALHLIGAPLLLWRRTRLAAFLLYTCFHLANANLFTIGLFPWISLLATLMFFDPDWPREIWRRLGGTPTAPRQVINQAVPMRPILALFFILFFTAQSLLPLRHFLYPGNVAWTGEGRAFAWRMKLHDRVGTVDFTVTDPVAGTQWDVAPGAEISDRAALLLPSEPDLIIQYAHYLRDRWALDHGIDGAEVRAHAMVSLNGRPPRPLVDPARDLANEPRTWQPYDWLLPLDTPLD